MAAIAPAATTPEQITELFNEGGVLAANQALTELESKTDPEAEELKPFQQTFKLIKFNAEQAQRATDLFSDTDGWTEQLNDDVLGLHTKSVDASNIVLKISFDVQCPIIKFLAILNEVDLLTQVFGENAQFTTIHDVSLSQKLIRSYTPMPWPVSARECYITVYAMDCFAEDGCVLVGAHSDEHYPAYPEVTIPEATRDAVRTQVPYSFGRLFPILSEDGASVVGTRVIIVRNQNMNSVVPNWLIMWLIRTFARKMVASFKQKAENLTGTEHDARIDSKPIYAKLGAKIDEYCIQH